MQGANTEKIISSTAFRRGKCTIARAECLHVASISIGEGHEFSFQHKGHNAIMCGPGIATSRFV